MTSNSFTIKLTGVILTKLKVMELIKFRITQKTQKLSILCFEENWSGNQSLVIVYSKSVFASLFWHVVVLLLEWCL